jgi:predicted enzyme related to lactoylglutathione lyase
MHLGAVRLFVNDMASARQFYGETLGLSLKHDGSAFGYCVFACGSVELVVEVVPLDAPPEDRSLVGRFTGLSFTVADIQAERRRLGALGVDFSAEPELQSWGAWLGTFLDPSSNALQLTQRAGEPIAPP